MEAYMDPNMDPYMDPKWILYGSYRDPFWILYRSHMDPQMDLYMDPIWIPIWILYVEICANLSLGSLEDQRWIPIRIMDPYNDPTWILCGGAAGAQRGSSGRAAGGQRGRFGNAAGEPAPDPPVGILYGILIIPLLEPSSEFAIREQTIYKTTYKINEFEIIKKHAHYPSKAP